MDNLLKQRLVGAIVIVSLGIIFIPMLLTGKGGIEDEDPESFIPPMPAYELKAPTLPQRQLSVNKPEPVDATQLLAQANQEQPAAKIPEQSDAKPAPATDTTPKVDAKVKPTKPVEQQQSAASSGTAAKTAAKTETKTETQKTATQAATGTPKSQPETTQTQSQTADKPAQRSTKEVLAQALKAKPVTSGWVVQLGSFSVQQNAQKLRDTLRKKGHPSFVEAFQSKKGKRYRVRVGPQATREEAEKLSRVLKTQTKLTGLVMHFPQAR